MSELTARECIEQARYRLRTNDVPMDPKLRALVKNSAAHLEAALDAMRELEAYCGIAFEDYAEDDPASIALDNVRKLLEGNSSAFDP